MCMTHVAMHNFLCKRHLRQHACISDSMALFVLLIFFKTQLFSNGLVNMNLLACYKLERTDKATRTLIL